MPAGCCVQLSGNRLTQHTRHIGHDISQETKNKDRSLHRYCQLKHRYVLVLTAAYGTSFSLCDQSDHFSISSAPWSLTGGGTNQRTRCQVLSSRGRVECGVALLGRRGGKGSSGLFGNHVKHLTSHHRTAYVHWERRVLHYLKPFGSRNVSEAGCLSKVRSTAGEGEVKLIGNHPLKLI